MPDLTPGVASALSPLVRRVVAPNPSLMTGPGTNSYLVGIDEVAVIDPGPDDKKHIDAIVGAAMRERVRELAGSTTQVITDDRALDKRAIELLAAILVRQNGDGRGHRSRRPGSR